MKPKSTSLFLYAVAFLAIASAIGIRASTSPQSGVEILASDDSGCTLSFSPEAYAVDTVTVNGRPYGSVRFERSVPFGQPGDPDLPCLIFILGVPQQGEVRTTVIETVPRDTKTLRLIPLPGVEKQNGIASSVYDEGSLYRQPSASPAEPCRIFDIGWSGSLRIVRIAVIPVRFDPRNNTLELYAKIVFRVDFGAAGSAAGIVSAPEDTFIRNAVLNADVARKWQVRQAAVSRRMGKAALSGSWYKIPVSQEGVYKITGSFLKTNGIDLGSIQPATLKICNNGGRELPRAVSASRPDSLVENPILVSGVEDGRFDEGDYILFYGRGVTGWEYNSGTNQWNHYNHLYTARNIYWLGFNDGRSGKRIPTEAVADATPQPFTRFVDHFFDEQDKINPLGGGLVWLGREFDAASGAALSFDSSFDLPGLISGDSIQIRIQFRGGEQDRYIMHRFGVKFNGASLPVKQFYSDVFHTSKDILIGAGITGKNTLSFSYTSDGAEANAYLDWFEIEYRRSLNTASGQLLFYSIPASSTVSYALTGFSNEPSVFDITTVSDIRRLPVRQDGSQWLASDNGIPDGSKRYLAVQESAFLSPGEGIQKDDVSDLRSAGNAADLIIVTHDDFMEQVLRYKAFKETWDSLSVFVADVQDVYDEFSAGLLDPTAIRDFVKCAFERWSKRPSALLLFGDGDFDYRNILSSKDKNWIPPYEAEGNYYAMGSRTTDDWFVYVAGGDDKIDLAVGRIPVQSSEQAATVVDKLIQYQSNPDWGAWKSLITFVGDDEKSANPDFDNEVNHIRASEEAAENVVPPEFDLRKIYLTEYPEEIQTEGRRKPKAHEDLLDQINRGTLAVNFIGHANEDVWTHEQIFNHETDIPVLRNAEHLAFFYAATCSFAWYDAVDKQSFAEDLLVSEGKGAIAVIAASRECAAGSNEALNREFLRRLFESGKRYRIGEALRLAKLSTYDVFNNELYNVIGDPTLRLAFPVRKASFTDLRPDTFKALSLVSANGQVGTEGNSPLPFQGKAVIKGVDSKKPVSYTTRWGTRLDYLMPGNVLFRGEAAVANGTFRISFIVPKEISYGTRTAKLSAYFWNETGDGLGAKSGIAVGGTANVLDDQGPDIQLGFSDMESFVSGGMIHPDPELLAVVKDEQTGVNLTGEIGHTLALTLDGQPAKNVTDYFQYDEGSYLQGKLHYPMIGLSEGDHEIILKAWDNANNSSVQTLSFRILRLDELRLENVLNYPNPFSSSTHFTFQLNQSAGVEIKIYTVDGRMIRKLDDVSGQPGFNMIPWDGLDEAGDSIANGVYLYRVSARIVLSDKTIEASEIGRLLIMR